jgi:hypothetical protein
MFLNQQTHVDEICFVCNEFVYFPVLSVMINASEMKCSVIISPFFPDTGGFCENTGFDLRSDGNGLLSKWHDCLMGIIDCFFFLLFYDIILLSRAHENRKNVQWDICSIKQCPVLNIDKIWILINQILLKDAFPSIFVTAVVKFHLVQVNLHLFRITLFNFFVIAWDKSVLLTHFEDVWSICIDFVAKLRNTNHFYWFPVSKTTHDFWSGIR